jgi:PAS domain S-box-containing protein
LSLPDRAAMTVRRLVPALGIGAALIVMAVTAAIMWTAREDALERAETRLGDLSLVLAEQTARSIGQIDSVLQGVTADIARRAAAPQAESEAALHQALAAHAGVPQLQSRVVFDPNGRGVASSHEFPLRTVEAADRAYFRAHRERTTAGLHLDAVPKSRITGLPSVTLSRRIAGAGDELRAVVVAFLDTSYLTGLSRTLALGPGGGVGLYRTDGAPVAGTAASGESAPLAPALRAASPGSVRTAFVDGPDGERITAAAALADLPLVLAVSSTTDFALQAWRRDALVAAALGALAAAVVFTLAFAIHRRLESDRHHRAEMIESAARLDAIVQSAMNAIITVDADQRIVVFNAAAEQMFGCSAAEALGSPLERFIPERFRAVHHTHLERFAHTGETARRMGLQTALWALRADGTEFPIEASISQAAVQGERLFSVILRDIAERVRAEAELLHSQQETHESEQRLDAIVRSAMDAIITVDASQRIVLFNAAAEQMLGCAAAEALGGPLDRFIPERFRAAHHQHVGRFGRTGDTARRMGPRIALSALRSDGTEFPIEASISQAAVGDQQLFTVILRDVSERARAESEVRHAQEQQRELAVAMLEVREAERTRIARELHDELGQALSGLKMDVELLARMTPGERFDLLERLADMRQLLDATVATTRRISADLRPLVLDDLGLGAAAQWLVQNVAQRSGLACDLDLDPACEHLGEPHASALFRIMQESLTNVVRHARAQRVGVRLERAGAIAVLTVSDDGVGMADGARAKPRSFGLRGISERALLLGGAVSITTAPEGGTTVLVRLPLDGERARDAA